jgi:hypothetical protein
MSRRPPRTAGIALAALATLGCGEDPGIEKGSVPFKGTNTSSLAPLRDDMTKNMQNRSYLKKSEDAGRPAAAPEGVGGSGPGAAAKPAGEPGPAAGSAPAAGPRPAGEPKARAGPKPPTPGG